MPIRSIPEYRHYCIKTAIPPPQQKDIMKLATLFLFCLLMLGCQIPADHLGKIAAEAESLPPTIARPPQPNNPITSLSVEQKDYYRALVDICIQDFASCDFRVRIAAFSKLSQQNWNNIEPFIPRNGDMNVMWNLKKIERVSRPEMREWYNSYIRACEQCEIYSKKVKPSEDPVNNKWFASGWAERKPKSIFDPEPEPVQSPISFNEWQ